MSKFGINFPSSYGHNNDIGLILDSILGQPVDTWEKKQRRKANKEINRYMYKLIKINKFLKIYFLIFDIWVSACGILNTRPYVSSTSLIRWMASQWKCIRVHYLVICVRVYTCSVHLCSFGNSRPNYSTSFHEHHTRRIGFGIRSNIHSGTTQGVSKSPGTYYCYVNFSSIILVDRRVRRHFIGNPASELRASRAIWDHTVLPATRHKWTSPALTLIRQAGTRFTYPGERWKAELT